MTFMEFCTTGLASFMIGVNTLAVTVFFGDWLHRQVTGDNDRFKNDICADPVLVTAFCILPENESPLYRRGSSAIKVSRPL